MVSEVNLLVIIQNVNHILNMKSKHNFLQFCYIFLSFTLFLKKETRNGAIGRCSATTQPGNREIRGLENAISIR